MKGNLKKIIIISSIIICSSLLLLFLFIGISRVLNEILPNESTPDIINISLTKNNNMDNIKVSIDKKWLNKPEPNNSEGIDAIIYVYDENEIDPIQPNNQDIRITGILFNEFKNQVAIENGLKISVKIVDKSTKDLDSIETIQFKKTKDSVNTDNLRVFYMHGYAVPMGPMHYWVKEGKWNKK